MRGLARRLDHEDPVAGRVEALQGGGAAVELVAQHEHQVAQGHQAAVRRLRRQASEQCRTSAQFFAQRRRQVMGRPQVAQGLDGRPALLPAKGRDMVRRGRIGGADGCV